MNLSLGEMWTEIVFNTTDEDNPSIVDSNSRLTSLTANRTLDKETSIPSSGMVPLNGSSFSNITKHSNNTLDLNNTMIQGIKVELKMIDNSMIASATEYSNHGRAF